MTYPGSTTPLRAPAEAVAAAHADEPKPAAWDDNPQILWIDGEEVEFFPIGALSMALHRDANTLREWEQLQYLPQARWRSAPKNEGARAKHGRRRLYSRAQIEGLREIAAQEGVLDQSRPVGSTNFPARARDLFERLRSEV